MTEKKQIEEMALVLSEGGCGKECDCIEGDKFNCHLLHSASVLYNAGYRKQSEGEWEWFEEWSPSTPEYPRECDDCGWRCDKCKTALADAVGGYWDDPLEKPNLNFCPNCGAKMKGGEE